MMQRWSASSSADDSDSSQDTRLRHDERLKRRQRVKRRTLTRSASSDTSSDFLPPTPLDVTPEKKGVKETEQHKSSPFHWSPLKNAFRSLILSPKEPKPKPVAKSILRSPVMHVYVKGPSGLPTQRVPIGAARFTDFYCVQRSVTLRALLLEP